MRSASRLLGLLVAVGLAGGQFCLADPRPPKPKSAKSVLYLSMTKARRVLLSAVMTQRVSHSRGLELELRVEQDGRGRVKLTTNGPHYLQGIVSLDDGKVWKTYFPRERRIMVQQSPRAEQDNPYYQVALAQQNYTLTLGSGGTIAGCQTLCVTAIPKNKGLSRRRYYMDSRTYFVLRQEIIEPDGDKKVHLDTKAITYLSSPPSMDLGDEGKARVTTSPSPEKVSPPSSAKPKVGFVPITPDQLPLGFIVRETQVVGGEFDKFAAVRITDGFVTATVYQWDSDRRSRRWPYNMRRGYRETKGVRLTIVGDMPRGALDTVLAGFTR